MSCTHRDTIITGVNGCLVVDTLTTTLTYAVLIVDTAATSRPYWNHADDRTRIHYLQARCSGVIPIPVSGGDMGGTHALSSVR